MTLLKVAPDRTWSIVESRLRFPVDALVPPAVVPIVVAKDLARSIEILETNRGWRRIETVPTHRNIIGKPCCPQIMAKPGTVLTLRFEMSPYQGDTDDAHNFNEVSDGSVRLWDEGLIDWTAVLHFWQPAITVNLAELAENKATMTPDQGFATWDSMGPESWPALRKRFAADG